jgi:hypothetical protein
MLLLAIALAVLLIIGILLAPLGVGIVVVVVVLAIAVAGWLFWALLWGVSRRRVRTQLEHPEFLGPGGPDDPDRTEPVGTDAEQQRSMPGGASS